MLILTRKPGESLLIGEDVEVVVLGQVGNTTRLGIAAPASVSLLRKELRERLDEEGSDHG